MRVGTCGWQYRHFRGVLYPEDVPLRDWLRAYGERFDTVENDGTFYKLPKRETFEKWRKELPSGFVMALKASRFLTHIKRLKDPEEPVERLLDAARGLRGKLGPILLQLPPTLRVDPARLEACLRRFPRDVRVAVEPRHESWWIDEVREVLEHSGAALCWADRDSRPITPLWRTTDWVYLRLHEGRAHPHPEYGDQALRSWVRRIVDAYGQNPDAYVYFNNDANGAAVRNARRFLELDERRDQTTGLRRHR